MLIVGLLRRCFYFLSTVKWEISDNQKIYKVSFSYLSMNKGVTTIKVKEKTRKNLQLAKQRGNFKNVDEVIKDALSLSGPKAIKKGGVQKK